MFESLTAVIVLIVFLVPAYVWRAVEGCFVALEREAKWEMLALGLLTRSTIIYLPLLPFLYIRWEEKWHEQHPWKTCLVSLLCIVVIPAALGFLTGISKQKRWLGALFEKLGLRAFNSIPTAWESYFSQASASWVIVTLKNGQRVHGFFGDGSHASSEAKNHDIYLSHTVAPTNGGFKLVPHTKGVYIPASEILTIEFIAEGEQTNAAET